MPITIETVEQKKYREGKVLTFIGSGSNLLAGSVSNIVIETGSKPVDLASISLTSSGTEEISWQAFAGAVFTKENVIQPVVRNSVPSVKREVKAYLNPAIGNDGIALFANPILVIAQLGAGTRNFIDSDIVESEFKLQPNSSYLIRFTNSGTITAKYTVTMDLWLD